jgi:hypothetical protein
MDPLNRPIPTDSRFAAPLYRPPVPTPFVVVEPEPEPEPTTRRPPLHTRPGPTLIASLPRAATVAEFMVRYVPPAGATWRGVRGALGVVTHRLLLALPRPPRGRCFVVHDYSLGACTFGLHADDEATFTLEEVRAAVDAVRRDGINRLVSLN